MTALIAALVLTSSPQRPILSFWEEENGFKALFNGKNLSNWRGYKRPNPPGAWKAVNGELVISPGRNGGDICTEKEYADFDLRLEWNTTKGGNSGVIYRSSEDYNASWQTGPEYQIFDDYQSGTGKADLHSAGSLYDLYIPTRFVTRKPGEWNETRIVVKGNHLEHWLNGHKVVNCEVGSTDWNERIAKSKFKSYSEFGRKKKGYILLQDHGAVIKFRRIRIKELSGDKR